MVSCFLLQQSDDFCKLVSYIIPTKRNIIRKKQILNRITFQYESKKFFAFLKWMHHIYSKIINDKRYILRYNLYFSLLKYPNIPTTTTRYARSSDSLSSVMRRNYTGFNPLIGASFNFPSEQRRRDGRQKPRPPSFYRDTRISGGGRPFVSPRLIPFLRRFYRRDFAAGASNRPSRLRDFR